MISPDVVFNFSKFWFFGLLGGTWAKNGQNDKVMSVVPDFSGTICHDGHLWPTCVKW